MPKKRKAKRLPKTIQLPKNLPDVTFPQTRKPQWCAGRPWSKTNSVVVILALIILALFAVNRGLIFAAIVNGKPVFRISLNKTLLSRYGQQTLESMITEQLINGEAKRAGVAVTQKDIDAKEKEILKSFGGDVTMDDVLKFQGMTKADFDSQIKLQMLLMKLVGKNVVITDSDIEQYIATNSATLVATEEAALKSEAREAILSQKVVEQIQPWFTELRNKAKILRFVQ